MDYNYLFALLSLVVGVGAGFRDMYDHFQRAAFSGAATRWGLAYLASRGFVPAATFVILLASGLIENWLPATAIGCGLGLEAVLRAKIYLKREEDAKGNFQESYLEIFKLLQWYQDLMLVQAAELLSVQAQSTVRQYVEREENFQAMSDLFQENRGAWKRQDDIPPSRQISPNWPTNTTEKGATPRVRPWKIESCAANSAT